MYFFKYPSVFLIIFLNISVEMSISRVKDRIMGAGGRPPTSRPRNDRH
jgi:hypothetical protein